MPFEKGKSGNPDGRPKGALNKRTLIGQSILDNDAEALVKRVVQLALEGDTTCLRICVERLVPARKSGPLWIDLPDVTAVAEIPKLFTAINERFREGITHSEAATLLDLTETLRKSLEVVEIETRITALEEESESRRY